MDYAAAQPYTYQCPYTPSSGPTQQWQVPLEVCPPSKEFLVRLVFVLFGAKEEGMEVIRLIMDIYDGVIVRTPSQIGKLF